MGMWLPSWRAAGSPVGAEIAVLGNGRLWQPSSYRMQEKDSALAMQLYYCLERLGRSEGMCWCWLRAGDDDDGGSLDAGESFFTGCSWLPIALSVISGYLPCFDSTSTALNRDRILRCIVKEDVGLYEAGVA